MNYCNIKKEDIADGVGVRVSLFVSGCTHHCKGCFQPQTWNFEFGEPYTQAVEDELIEALKRPYIRGLTLLGGEPFEPSNQRILVTLLRRIRKELPEKTIWSYSGYLYDELCGWVEGTGRARCEVTDEMLSMIDVLVDGEFVEEQRNIQLKYRGSENQRVINVPKTRESGEVILEFSDTGRGSSHKTIYD